jgi:zinc transport system substrate-binding protein
MMGQGVFASDKVVITIKPLHSVASFLLDKIDTPKLLINGLVSPHYFTLKPSDARTIKQAELVVWVGENIESSLVKMFKNIPDNNQLRFYNEDHNDDGHIHQNQHFWLDPIQIKTFTERLYLKLDKLYPAHHVQLKNNYQHLLNKLTALDGHIKKSLLGKRISYITVHNDLQHFNLRYKLTQLASIQTNEHQTPSVKHILKLKKLLKGSPNSCILSSSQVPSKWVKILKKGNNNLTVTVDTIGLSLNEGKQLYFDLMQNLTAQIQRCHIDFKS